MALQELSGGEIRKNKIVMMNVKRRRTLSAFFLCLVFLFTLAYADNRRLFFLQIDQPSINEKNYYIYTFSKFNFD